MKKHILKITRYLIPLMPKGKSLAINMVLFLIGNKFEDVITLQDGRKLYIKEISPMKRSVFFLNKYEEYETYIIKNLIKTGDSVFDIGANFGWYSTLLGKLVGDRGKVFAFEMVSSIAKECRHNARLNYQKNVVVESMAMGEKDGMIDCLYSESLEIGNLRPAMLAGGGNLKTEIVKITSLDNYVEKNNIKNIAFIKCDIDGGEVPFIKGARKTLSLVQPAIIIEVQESSQKTQDHSCREIFEELSRLGYKFFSLNRKLEIIEKSEFDNYFNDNILCLSDKNLSLQSATLNKLRVN